MAARTFSSAALQLLSALMCTGMSAAAAHADCVPITFPTLVPFAGARVPQNADLLFVAFGGEAFVDVRFPDGHTEQVASEQSDGRFIHRLVLATPHAVGDYLVALDPEVSFTVVEGIDVEAPAVPTVSTSRMTSFVPPLPPWSECPPPEGGFHDTVTLDVNGPDDARLVFVDGRLAAVADANGFAEVTRGESRGGDVSYAVTVRDFAGNESAAVDASVNAGCAGGCASLGGASPLALVLVLLARLRRARRRMRTA